MPIKQYQNADKKMLQQLHQQETGRLLQKSIFESLHYYSHHILPPFSTVYAPWYFSLSLTSLK